VNKLLYLGSGLSLGAYRAARGLRSRSRAGETTLSRHEWPSLLLNLEGVFTAVVAWVVFPEHVDARIAGGMVAISLGAVLLTWDPGQPVKLSAGALLVAGACLGWAIDNNLI